MQPGLDGATDSPPRRSSLPDIDKIFEHPVEMARYRLLATQPTRRRTIWREIEAELREWAALLRMFWKSLLLFVLIIAAGGALYVLLTPSDDPDRMILGESVYFMLQLMLFGVDHVDFPPDLARQVFFLMMPILGWTTVVGSVVQFTSALLNRSNRSEEWEVALADTYRNHAIVCGVGHVGTRVVRHLLALQCDVVVIESNPKASGVEEVRAYEIPLLLQDASKSETLVDAGVERADTLLVCTDDDMANIAVTIHARELNPDIRIVVRMFNDSLAMQVRDRLGADAVYSTSMLAAPVFAGLATRTEVAQSYVVGEEVFSMARLEVSKHSPLVGQSIEQIERPEQLDVVLHISGAEATPHPDTGVVVRAGDELVVFAREDMLLSIAQRNRGKPS